MRRMYRRRLHIKRTGRKSHTTIFQRGTNSLRKRNGAIQKASHRCALCRSAVGRRRDTSYIVHGRNNTTAKVSTATLRDTTHVWHAL